MFTHFPPSTKRYQVRKNLHSAFPILKACVCGEMFRSILFLHSNLWKRPFKTSFLPGSCFYEKTLLGRDRPPMTSGFYNDF